MGERLRFLPIILVLLIYVGVGVGINSGFAQTEGTYRVNISVATQDWFYPGEQVTVQITTLLDKYKSPPPGEPPPPLSPEDWVFMGNVPLQLKIKNEAGNLVDLDIPQDLRTDEHGFLEITFKAPEEEGKYTMTLYAIIEGVECSDSLELLVSSVEKPPLPTSIPTPTPGETPPTSQNFYIAIISIISVAVVATAILAIGRRRTSSNRKQSKTQI